MLGQLCSNLCWQVHWCITLHVSVFDILNSKSWELNSRLINRIFDSWTRLRKHLRVRLSALRTELADIPSPLAPFIQFTWGVTKCIATLSVQSIMAAIIAGQVREAAMTYNFLSKDPWGLPTEVWTTVSPLVLEPHRYILLTQISYPWLSPCFQLCDSVAALPCARSALSDEQSKTLLDEFGETDKLDTLTSYEVLVFEGLEKR